MQKYKKVKFYKIWITIILKFIVNITKYFTNIKKSNKNLFLNN